MLVNLTKTDFGSISENFPRIKLSNMYVVENPASVGGYSYISRPSLTTFATMTSGNIRGIFYQSTGGTVTIYIVSGNNLYTLNPDGSFNLIGSTPGTDFCTFASTIYNIGILSGGNVFLYDGATLTQVVLPNAGYVMSAIASLDNYYIISLQNTSKFYFIRPGNTTILPLDFESAERNPDDIVSISTIGDELWVIGKETVEIFIDSGAQAAPFTRIPGRVYQTGCVDKRSLVKCNKNSLPCLVWVTPTREVMLAQGIPSKISNESVEELLRNATSFVAWSFRTNRHDFYVITTENETQVFDLNLGNWYRWSTYGQGTWNAYSGIQIENTTYVIDNVGGNIYQLTTSVIDPNLDFIVCEVGGFMPNPTNTPSSVNSFTLFLNFGVSPLYTYGPSIELRFSDDGGRNWSEYYQQYMGARGMYDASVMFRSMGSVTRPGRYVELRFSELSNIRIDGLITNDTA